MRPSRGFTAVELLIVLAIAAILLAATVPSFSDTLNRHRANTAANEILRALSFARAQALSTGQRVVMAPTSGSAWSGGWRLFVDVDNNGAYLAGTDTQIEVFPAPGSQVQLASSAFGESGKTFVSFNQHGFARALNGTTVVTGQMSVTAGTQVLSVCLGATGRAAVVKGAAC